MALIATELNEFRKMLADHQDGKLKNEDVAARMAIYKQSTVRVRAISNHAKTLLQAKMKKEAKKLLRSMNEVFYDDIENVSDELPLYNRTPERGL